MMYRRSTSFLALASFLMAYEASPQHLTNVSSIPKASVLHIGIEWHIPVGCGFSGFYTEFLGVVSVLEPALPQMRITSGPCSTEFFEHQLFPAEAGPMSRANLPVSPQMRKDQEGWVKQNQKNLSKGIVDSLDSEAPSFGLPCAGASAYDVEQPKGGQEHTMFGVLLDRDLPGFDLPRARDGLPVANATVCDCLCLRAPACVAWTFRRTDRQCWLKASTPATTTTSATAPAQAPGLVSRRIAVNEEANLPTGVLTAAPAFPGSTPRPALPRIDVWHGRCDASEVEKRSRSSNTCAGRGGSSSSSSASGEGGEVNLIVVARLMTESARLDNTPGVLACAHAANEVWVPTEFHKALFVHALTEIEDSNPMSCGGGGSGGSRVLEKVVVVPEGVDSTLFVPGPKQRRRFQALLSSNNNRNAIAPGSCGGVGTHSADSIDDAAGDIYDNRSTGRSDSGDCSSGNDDADADDVDADDVDADNDDDGGAGGGVDFAFFSVFKWERRKGWDLLLDAWWEAFAASDPVVLRLRAWKPHWEAGSPDLNQQIDAYALSKPRPPPPPPLAATQAGGDGAREGATRAEGGWGSSSDSLGAESSHRYRETSNSKNPPPEAAKRYFSRGELARVEWLGSPGTPHAEELTRLELLKEYQDADAFVLPTRGEGWGLPAAEAMAVGLPTIVTNWSGPTGFATKDTAYLLPLEGEEESYFGHESQAAEQAAEATTYTPSLFGAFGPSEGRRRRSTRVEGRRQQKSAGGGKGGTSRSDVDGNGFAKPSKRALVHLLRTLYRDAHTPLVIEAQSSSSSYSELPSEYETEGTPHGTKKGRTWESDPRAGRGMVAWGVGLRARQRVSALFSPEAVGNKILERLHALSELEVQKK